MAAVAIVAPVPVLRGSATWEYGDPSLTNLRLSLLDREQSDGVTQRKRTGSSRNRLSWRWSWKQMLTKPFQNQTWPRVGSFKEKRNRKKRKSDSQNVSKNSVETRKKMDELYRIWLCDVEESSEESSDDEISERDRRRSCYPRFFGSDTSSSDSDTEHEEEHLVSQYVREGPSRIKVDVVREDERINEDHGRISDSSSESSDASSEHNLIQTEKQETINDVADHDNNGYQNILGQIENEKQYEVGETQTDNYEPESLDISQTMTAQSPKECVGIEKNTVNSETQSTIVSYPITKTIQTKAITPESQNSTNDESLLSEKSNKVVDPANTVNHEQYSTTDSVQIPDLGREIAKPHTSNISHDYLTSSLEVSSESGQGNAASDPLKREVTTGSPAMINNCRNGRVISVRQIYHQHILKRVDELCAQCGEKICASENGTNFQTDDEEGDAPQHTTRIDLQENRLYKLDVDGNSIDLDSPQEGWVSEKQASKHVVPDYPSTYPKTDTFHQMSAQNEEQYSRIQLCEFKRFGCQFSGTNMAVEQHMQSSLNDHLKLVSKLAQDQKEQLESQQLEQQKQGLLIQQLTDTVNNLEKLVREQNQMVQTQERTVHTLKDQIKDRRKQCHRFEREMTNQMQAFNQPPTSTLSTSTCEAEFVWPIRNFRKRLQRIQDGEVDDPLISEPFYTGTFGYKLSVWVYLNGRGKTLGDWVSVYARVMPSDHDNILCWPVKPMYTFTLLDQSEGEKDHIVRTRKVNDIKRDGGKHHGIHRPEGGERSVIVGFDDFVAHAQLEKRNYLVDDCVYLKVQADIVY